MIKSARLLCFLVFVVSSLEGADIKCVNHLVKNFFVFEITTQALSLHDVPQSQWTPIYTDLRSLSSRLPRMIEEQAKTLSVNPFDTLAYQEEAWDLTKTILFDQFSIIIRKYFNATDYDLKRMFTYIMEQQLSKLIACFGDDVFHPKKKKEKHP